MSGIPERLRTLHSGEEHLRRKACELVEADVHLALHLALVEDAMDLLDVLRQAPLDDEDSKVVMALGLRTFNAFAAAIKLGLSGYSQAAVLPLRDVLECIFLVDLFRIDHATIGEWRLADKRTKYKRFRPIKVREHLDLYYGHTTQKRAALYDLYSELGGHPTMASFEMLRPDGTLARNGPWIELVALRAVLSEAARLAAQIDETFGAFLPRDWPQGMATLRVIQELKAKWMSEIWNVEVDENGPGALGPGRSEL